MSDDERQPPKVPGREMRARPLPRRFYQAVTVGDAAAADAAPSGLPSAPRNIAVLLDGKTARTPKKSELRLPTLALARAVAGEWAAQQESVDPGRMPLTRLANTAIDGVRGREADVAADIVKYSGSDLVCYRAERPQGLMARQAALWDPVVDFARQQLGAEFAVGQGLMHVAQSPESAAAVRRAVGPLEAFPLTALHTMTTLTGSALLALGVLRGAWTVDTAWTAAHVDEDWQIAQWGEDAEAKARREARWVEMSAAARMLRLLA